MQPSLYKPLDASRHEVRLLRFSSALRHPEKIELVFDYVFLDDNPVFDALSYTWGSDERQRNPDGGLISPTPKPRLVTIEGVIIEVTSNLFGALENLRNQADLPLSEANSPLSEPRFTYSTRLWVDALCINQEDVSERNQQVAQMRYVYEKAACVLVWPSIPTSEGQKELAAFLCSLGDDATRVSKALMVPHSSDLLSKLRDPAFNISWDALKNILEAPYWTRLWVVRV